MAGRFSSGFLRCIRASNICIIKPSAFGDVVQALPLLPALRERFPGARISWLINQSLRDLVHGHPDLDSVLEFNRHGSWSDWWNTLSQLRRERFDLVLDLQGLLRTGIMTRWTRAPIRIGLETAREGSSLSYHGTIPGTGRDIPAHARYLRVAEALGVDPSRHAGRIAVPPGNESFVRNIFQTTNPPVLAVHAGARWETKRWPVEQFAEVIRRTVLAYRATVVLIGSPDERPLADELRQTIVGRMTGARILDLVGKTSLSQLMAILDSCDLLLSNDSGPMHLAAGLGTPVVGLFTCTSPVLSGPPPGIHQLVATNVACAASYCRQCPHVGEDFQKCHRELNSDRVWSAVQLVMDQTIIAPSAA